MEKRNICTYLILAVCLCLSMTSVYAFTNETDPLKNVDIYDFDEKELRVQKIAKDAGLHRNQVVELFALGYTEDKIRMMDMEEADKILTEGMSYEELSMYYTHIAPRAFSEYVDKFPNDYFPPQSKSVNGYCADCGYTPSSKVNWNHATATGGYGGDGCFHEDSGTIQSNINSKCYYAKMLAMYIFNVTSSSNLGFDYYLFGENYGAAHPDWAHEGVDMKYRTGAEVRSPIRGVVTYSSTSKKQVNIYDPDRGITMNFQHLNDIDGTGDLSEGSQVTRGQILGKQNSTDGHVHVQVCDHKNNNKGCTVVHSGQDSNVILDCIEPYGYH